MPSRPLAFYATAPDRGSFWRNQAGTAGCLIPAYLAGRNQLRNQLWPNNILLGGRLRVMGPPQDPFTCHPPLQDACWQKEGDTAGKPGSSVKEARLRDSAP
ncbi:hypothetical protein CVIRNUC_000229 [Coccomyxa viridis]|uniref:Uncharacterized protein n=1 Tax=Coccomyxa viridis TaxID=1274662 RepID=A0AAV1HT75_9CHLO|nr:hypothetical protein CVIRNUC_000229 [Coccomyxa viridis]